MIARKITYKGQFQPKDFETMYDITRRVEITGELKSTSQDTFELSLEGDPSMIKLVEHQIERRLKNEIKSKEISPIPYQYFTGINFLG